MASIIGYTQTKTDELLAGKVDGDDDRLSDARTPTAHKTSHATGGSDALTPADIGAATAAQGDLALAPSIQAPKPARATWLSTFQSGHGWASHSATPIEDDATVYMMGAQSVCIPSGASAQKTGLSLDLTDRHLALWVRVEDLTKLTTGLLVYAGTSGLSSFYSWNVIANDPAPWFRAGEWAYVTLPWPSSTITGTPNRAAINTIRITHLTTGATAWVQGIGHAPDSPRWPNGLVTLTFDDGYTSNLEAAKLSMSPRGYTGTLFMIADRVGASGFMTAAEIVELGTRYGWDIEAHGLPNYTTLTDDELRVEFAKTKAWIASHGLGRGDHMAYPMGYSNDRVIGVAREFFATCRTIAGRQQETWPPAQAHRLRALTGISSYAGGVSLAATKAAIDKARANKSWLILVFHRITATPASPMDCTPADLEAICDYLTTTGVEVRTMADALLP